jgi:hypothetical protein
MRAIRRLSGEERNEKSFLLIQQNSIHHDRIRVTSGATKLSHQADALEGLKR